MSPYSYNPCDFQRFLLFRNKARNAGRSGKNAGNKEKCGISRTIAGRLTPMHLFAPVLLDTWVLMYPKVPESDHLLLLIDMIYRFT